MSAAARTQGATVVAGGGIPDVSDNLAGGFWIEPTLWTGLPETATVVQEEVFGPVAHTAPFDHVDEVVALANDSRCGLPATLLTDNLGCAHCVAPRLETWIVWVNTWNTRDLRTPFGGAKQSGIGRAGGAYSLDFYSEIRNICSKL